MANWLFESLAGHDRDGFSCGKPLLDRFIVSQASQYERREVGRTYVAVRPGERQVIGYYTLAAAQIGFERFPPELAKKLPKHPVPVVLLGRLAVDQSSHGQGLGGDLLIDAFKKSAAAADIIGACAVFVEAIDVQASGFYVKYGFVPLIDQALHLVMPMAAARRVVASQV